MSGEREGPAPVEHGPGDCVPRRPDAGHGGGPVASQLGGQVTASGCTSSMVARREEVGVTSPR